MPFTSAATPFLLSLTIHFGSVVLSLPGYSATYPTRPESAVTAVKCRDVVDEVDPRSRLHRICALASRDARQLALNGVGEPGTDWIRAIRPGESVPMLAGTVPLPGLPWLHRGGVPASGGYAIPANAIQMPSATLPRVWLSLQGK